MSELAALRGEIEMLTSYRKRLLQRAVESPDVADYLGQLYDDTAAALAEMEARAWELESEGSFARRARRPDANLSEL